MLRAGESIAHGRRHKHQRAGRVSFSDKSLAPSHVRVLTITSLGALRPGQGEAVISFPTQKVAEKNRRNKSRKKGVFPENASSEKRLEFQKCEEGQEGIKNLSH